MTPERLEELRNRATRPRRTVPIVCNGDLAEQIANVQDELLALDRAAAGATGRRLASRSSAAKAAELDAQLDALYDEARDDTLLIVVEGVPGTVWKAFVAAHPPKPGDDGKPRPGYDGWIDRETAEDLLIRACAIGMRSTPDGPIQVLPDETLDWLLGDGVDAGFATIEQRESLFIAAFAVCRGNDAVPLRLRRSTTPTSDAE